MISKEMPGGVQTWLFRVSVGHGDGQVCAECGEPIAHRRPQYRLEFAAARPPQFLHLLCYDAWHRRFARQVQRPALTVKTDN